MNILKSRISDFTPWRCLSFYLCCTWTDSNTAMTGVCTALHLLSSSPHDGVLLNNLVVLIWVLELWHFIHTDTRHVLTGHYAACHVLSPWMPDVFSFKEHDSLNSRFRKFYSALWPSLRKFGRGCTLCLSHLMPRSSCWLSCFVLGRSWFRISVGVVSAPFHYDIWGSTDGADSDCDRVGHGILPPTIFLPAFRGNTPLPSSE
jgi:hypothetical protein